jgi:hypothetical protein
MRALILLLASGCAFADAITTSFSCSATGATSVTGSAPCDVVGVGGFTPPSAFAGWEGGVPPNLPTSFGPTTSFSESAGVRVLADPGDSASTFTMASASVNSTITAISSGPPREGLIEIVLNPTGDDLFGLASAEAQVGPYSAFFPGGIFGTYTFELGVPFQINLSAAAEGEGFSIEGPGDADAEAAITFSLFESDGVTPVTFSSAAPEPGTIVLCILGLVGSISVSFLKARRINRRPGQIASCGRGSESV